MAIICRYLPPIESRNKRVSEFQSAVSATQPARRAVRVADTEAQAPNSESRRHAV